MRRILPISAAILLLTACTGVRARAYAGAMLSSLRGDVALDSSAGDVDLRANRVGIERELGLGDHEQSPYLRAELGLPVGAVTLSGFRFNETGAGTLAANHRFGDIPAGSAVSSYLTFTNVKAAAHFALLDLGFVHLSPGLGVDFVDFDLHVFEISTANFERVDNEVFVPMLFVQTELDLGVVAATVDVGYMEADLEDADGRYLDVEALVRFDPLPMVELFAGYRLLDLDADGTADERRYAADVRLHGWMFGGGVTF